MTKDSIAQALEASGVSAGGQGYQIPENREGACLIATPGEVFSVDRLVRMDLRDKYVLLENSKHELFFFPYELVLGLRLLAAAASARAGFGR
jgi:hypothetical protein